MRDNNNSVLPSAIAFCVLSNKLFGAEKRFIRLAMSYATRHEQLRILLIVSHKLHDSICAAPEFSDVARSWKANGQLVVINTSPRVKPAALRGLLVSVVFTFTLLWNRVRLVHMPVDSSSTLHRWAFLASRLVLELTSVTATERLLKRFMTISRIPAEVLHAVSSEVLEPLETMPAKNLTEMEKKRGHAPVVVQAPLPFFYPDACKAPETVKKNTVLFAGRLVKRKNPMVFARAAVRFLKDFVDWNVVILGDGVLIEDITRVMHEFIAQERAQLTYTPNPMVFMRQSKIFVSIQSGDNYPSQSLLEAMSVGNAIVASDCGETSRLVDSDNGILVEISEEAVYGAIAQLAANPDLMARLGEQSRQKVIEEFNPEKYLRHLDALYSWCVSN